MDKVRFKVISSGFFIIAFFTIVYTVFIHFQYTNSTKVVKETDSVEVAGLVGQEEIKTDFTNPEEEDPLKGVSVYIPKGSDAKDPVIIEVVNMVMENARLAQEKDMDGYLSTFSTSIYESKESVKEFEDLFKNYDLIYTVTKIDITSISKDKVTAKVEKETVANTIIDGNVFRNNTSISTVSLVNQNGRFVIDGVKVDSVSYEDEK